MPRSEEPPSKRQRISQACETCRRRKSKCDGTQPRCAICASYNRVCTYETSGRKRGLQSGYVKSLEAILGLFIQDCPEREDELRALLRSSTVNDDILELTLIETSTEVWHQSGLHDDIQRLLNAEDKNQARAEHLPPLSPRCHVPIVSSSIQAPAPKSLEQAECITDTNGLAALPPNAIDLVEDYFHHVHCWFPIVERRDVLFTLHSYGEKQPTNVSQRGHRACLLAIQAVALAHYNSCVNDQADLPRLSELVRLEIGDSVNGFEIGHIQAALLLVLAYIGKHQLHTAWITLGQTTRMLQLCLQGNLGSTARMPHILRAYQMLDTILSIRLNKPWCSVLSAYHLEMDENDIDEWEAWCPRQSSAHTSTQSSRLPLRALSTFNLTSEAMRLLRNVITTSKSSSDVANAVESFEHWYDNIPAYARVTDLQTANPCTSNLRLLYNYAIMSIASNNIAQLQTVITKAIQSSLSLLERQMDYAGTRSPLSKLYLRQISELMDSFGTEHGNNKTEASTVLNQLIFNHGMHQAWKPSANLQESNQSLHTPTHIYDHDDLSGHARRDRVSENSHVDDVASRSEWIGHNACTITFPPSNFQELSQSDNAPQININSSCRSNLGSNDSMIIPLDEDFEALMENDFDIMLQDMPLLPNNHTLSAQTEFAQNFGFLSEDVNADFLALIEDTGIAPLT